MGSHRLPSVLARISLLVAQQPVFIRSIYAESLLEDFFVSAVGAVLGIRLYLAGTGYPRLTFGPLHIAHLVWGGLFMLVALLILLASLSYRGQMVAAVVGGVGLVGLLMRWASSSLGTATTSSVPRSPSYMPYS
jgi:hypothetical protein